VSRLSLSGWVFLAAAAAAGMWLAGVAGVIAVAVVATAILHTQRARRASSARVAQMIAWQQALGRLAAALRSGADLGRALVVAAEVPGSTSVSSEPSGVCCRSPAGNLSHAAASLRMGGDPAESLKADGHQTARHLAVCLSVTRQLGLSVVPVVVRLAEGEAAREQAAGDIAVALASARATAWLLAALPLLGLGLAGLVDRGAFSVLFASSVGRACLVAAALFEACGLVWVQRIDASASP
jgi:tight adherence protein B